MPMCLEKVESTGKLYYSMGRSFEGGSAWIECDPAVATNHETHYTVPDHTIENASLVEEDGVWKIKPWPGRKVVQHIWRNPRELEIVGMVNLSFFPINVINFYKSVGLCTTLPFQTDCIATVPMEREEILVWWESIPLA